MFRLRKQEQTTEKSQVLPHEKSCRVNQFGHGGTNVPPDFQNSSKKIMSHRLRVIKV